MDNNNILDESLFDKIKSEMTDVKLKARTQKSREWMMENIKNLSVNRRNLLKDPERFARQIFPGKMYFFAYDPKLKEELPYYDTYPVILAVERYNDGFLGLNLHYLPLKYRIIFLDRLYKTISNKRFSDSAKLKINYDILKSSTRFKGFEPCLKRYLTEHIRSRVLVIEPKLWEIALFLPIEKFAKKKASTVQRESIKSIS